MLLPLNGRRGRAAILRYLVTISVTLGAAVVSAPAPLVSSALESATTYLGQVRPGDMVLGGPVEAEAGEDRATRKKLERKRAEKKARKKAQRAKVAARKAADDNPLVGHPMGVYRAPATRRGRRT